MALDRLQKALGLKKTLEPPPVTWPSLRDDAKEAEAIEAWPRGVVSFDIAFDKRDVPYIFEIHGAGAGVTGIQELESEDVFTGASATDDAQLDFWIDKSQPAANNAKRLEELNRLKEIAKDWSRTMGRYPNPPWFDGVGGVTRDKRKQPPFILDNNRPETVQGGNFAHLFQKNERVVVKPPDESQGRGVRVYDANQVQRAHEYADQLTKRDGGFVAQRFIESRGAELAPPDLRGHAQSLRLLIPFKINDKGEVEVEIQKFGYQRVARFSGQEAEEGTRLRGKRVSVRDASVVNFSRDAAAVPMSDREYELALTAALPSIKKLTQFAKTQPDHLDKIRDTLGRRAEELHTQLMRKYSVRIEYPHRDYLYSSEPEYAQKIRAALEETKEYLSFLRFLEREFNAISPELWQSKTMNLYNSYCPIERIRGSNEATIRLRTWRGGQRSFNFALPTADGKDAPGSLKAVLENFVSENRGLISKIRGKP